MPILTQTGALRAWWALLMILVAAVLAAGACVLYTQHVQQESNRKWCALLTSLDQPEVPPTTERGRQVQQQIHDLRLGLGCGGT